MYRKVLGCPTKRLVLMVVLVGGWMLRRGEAGMAHPKAQLMVSTTKLDLPASMGPEGETTTNMQDEVCVPAPKHTVNPCPL